MRRLLERLFIVGLLPLLSLTAGSVYGEGEAATVRVRLTSNYPATLQVSTDTYVFCRAAFGGWRPVEGAVLTKDRVWELGWDKDNGTIVLTTDAGDRVISAQPLRLTPGSPDGTFQLFGRTYAGEIELFPGKNGPEAYNRTSLEDYVLGVMAGESVPGWHPEALKAQAVAARTFALRQKGRHGDFDFCDQPHCQRFSGITQEPSFIAAVSATKGQVLTYNGKLIWAFYFSSSGGRTENNDDVWGGEPLPYLRSVEDYDQVSDRCAWQSPYLMSVSEFLTRLGFPNWNACELKPVYSTRTGNLIAFTFRRPGDDKFRTLSREDIRWKLGLPSPRFLIRRVGGDEIRQALGRLSGGTVRVVKSSQEGERIRLSLQLDVDVQGEMINAPTLLDASEILFIAGRGYGHGVGLSQWGSQGMALAGKDYQAILHHYYGDEVSIVQYAP